MNVNVLEQNKTRWLGSAACASPSVPALGSVLDPQLVTLLLGGLAVLIHLVPSDCRMVGSWELYSVGLGPTQQGTSSSTVLDLQPK